MVSLAFHEIQHSFGLFMGWKKLAQKPEMNKLFKFIVLQYHTSQFFQVPFKMYDDYSSKNS